MQVFIANKRQAIEKYTRIREHSATLKQFYISPTGAFPQSFTHNPNKRKNEGVATSLERVDHSTTAPSSGLAPLVHVRLVHVHLSYTCTSRDSPGTPHTARPLRALFPSQPRSLRALFHTASISTSAFPHSLDLYERFSTQRPFARLLRTASRPLLSFATP